ncbi:3'-5' exonuclease [Adhaeribacter rhizoryzae]|nr:3'-5' exonuclease [Adhaeribacter rhizoryzae]
MIREDQLDPDQRDFVNTESRKVGNIWIKGFAGSGKSVLLVHSLRDILRKEPNAKAAIIVFTHSLKDMFEAGLRELGISNKVPVMTYYEFVDKRHDFYDYLFCDEVQDLPSRVLYAMQTRAKKVIVAGDSNQSIYDQDPKWRDATVDPDSIGDLIKARPFMLNTIHRLTRSIIVAVQKILPSINIWGAKRDLTKVDVNIRICEASSTEEEIKYVYKEAKNGASIGDTCAILIPTAKLIIKFVNELLASENKPVWNVVNNYYGKPDFGKMNRHLKSNGIKAQYIGNGNGSLTDAEVNRDIIIMTYHSSKGLDFDNVFIPFVNSSLYIGSNKVETLFMVAMTRSRKNLYFTYFGYTHDFLDKFKNDCTEINIANLLKPKNPQKTVSDFDF